MCRAHLAGQAFVQLSEPCRARRIIATAATLNASSSTEVKATSRNRLLRAARFRRTVHMARSSNHKLRIGIIGAGEIVRNRHLPGA